MPDGLIPWLLLPVKSLREGKRRLSPVLDDVQRLRLNEYFLRRMLAVARDFPGLDRTVVVSDGDDTLRLAQSIGARTVHASSSGLNHALSEGYMAVTAPVIILPVDLPLVESPDLEELSAIGTHHEMVICPDKDNQGTNALFLANHIPLQFHFGVSSFRRHQLEAHRCGITPYIFFSSHITIDVDVPADLAVMNNQLLESQSNA